jgi:C-terminal processing protease CtpA/Prc
MVAFFATEPFTVGSKFLIRSSEISKNFWKEMNDTSQLFIDIKKEILSKENGVRFEMSTAKYKYPPRTDSLKFKGNVYVLINRFSGSQAIEVPAMIQHYGFGKLIGEQTAPLTDANARQFKLPNTQLTVMFPEAFYGDSSMANGVIPDHLIHDDILTEKDEILDYALRLIEVDKDMDRR